MTPLKEGFSNREQYLEMARSRVETIRKNRFLMALTKTWLSLGQGGNLRMPTYDEFFSSFKQEQAKAQQEDDAPAEQLNLSGEEPNPDLVEEVPENESYIRAFYQVACGYW